jgi:Ca2+-binding RTX toxin-like protein
MPTLSSGQTATDAINGLYLTVLRRSADPSGLSFWEAQFNGGTSLDSIRDSFVASPESSSLVDPVIRLYEVAFGRQVNETELTSAVSLLKGGATLESIAESLAGTQEFSDRLGTGVDRSALVENLYVNGLGRVSDAPGKAFWVGSDFSTGQLLLGFSESLEARARLDDSTTIFLTNLSEGVAADTSVSLTAASSDQFAFPQINFIGGAGSDNFTAGQGDDTLDGRAGDDILTGAGGNDLFIFIDGSGNDTVTDFVAGAGTDDQLDITAFGFATFADVIKAASQAGNDTLIQLDADDSVTLLGVSLGDLVPFDFVI